MSPLSPFTVFEPPNLKMVLRLFPYQQKQQMAVLWSITELRLYIQETCFVSIEPISAWPSSDQCWGTEEEFEIHQTQGTLGHTAQEPSTGLLGGFHSRIAQDSKLEQRSTDDTLRSFSSLCPAVLREQKVLQLFHYVFDYAKVRKPSILPLAFIGQAEVSLLLGRVSKLLWEQGSQSRIM